MCVYLVKMDKFKELSFVHFENIWENFGFTGAVYLRSQKYHKTFDIIT